VRVDECVRCQDFPCADVEHSAYAVPEIELDVRSVSLLMVSEAAPRTRSDWFYSPGEPLFAQTTLQAFCDAGAQVSSMDELLELGVHVTTAVKCGKTGYGIATGTVKTCSQLLEAELALFPAARVLMLMGDVAIKALNAIARRNGEPRVIPAGSTYKLRGPEYRYHGLRVFPSYLQAGPSFLIEKSKRQMIAEDIASALTIAGKR
jgi:uracil-DNA glycosylase